MKKNRNKRCYLSGKIGGLKRAKVEANFARARYQVFLKGYTPISPWPAHLPEKAPYWMHMICDIAVLFTCDAIALMPNCTLSKGSKIEWRIAKALNKQIIHLYSPEYL